ncbi:hypothetical protein GUJ93_ZPchr0009g2444 [Zizania palustris]|uniref:Uncharacterized protein n=1 Tax=Zizania palustris TaxID=103762 RepID=A0A8J5R488_ZIZPA|nr:hypothetical protein GUJ93_ZPchr0009g2444 [Zizania palustris]
MSALWEARLCRIGRIRYWCLALECTVFAGSSTWLPTALFIIQKSETHSKGSYAMSGEFEMSMMDELTFFLALDPNEDGEAIDQEFRRMIGSLLYLTATRPYILRCVSVRSFLGFATCFALPIGKAHSQASGELGHEGCVESRSVLGSRLRQEVRRVAPAEGILRQSPRRRGTSKGAPEGVTSEFGGQSPQD